MNRIHDPNTLIAIARGVKETNENIRVGAIRGAEHLPIHDRWRLLAALLSDKVLAVRSEAARVLVPAWEKLTADQRDTLKPALEDYLQIQKFNEDRGFGHTNRANVLMPQGKALEAIKSYKNSIRIEPYFINAYINLAEVYRLQKKNIDSLKTLKAGESAIPNNANLVYSIALAHLRLKQNPQALKYLKKSILIAPKNPRFHYVYGLIVERANPEESQNSILKAYQLSQNPQYLYALCEIQIRQSLPGAQKTLRLLEGLIPEKALQVLKKQLQLSPNK